MLNYQRVPSQYERFKGAAHPRFFGPAARPKGCVGARPGARQIGRWSIGSTGHQRVSWARPAYPVW